MANIKEIKRKKGKRYRIDYYDAQGVRHRDSFDVDYKTAKEIAAKLEYRKSLVKGGVVSHLKPNIGLVKAINQYFNIAEVQKKPNTLAREKFIFDRLVNYVGNIRIRHINLELLQGYVARRHKHDQVRPATIRIEIKTLRMFFNTLIDHGYLESNPINGIKGPAVQAKPIRFLTKDEILALITEIDDQNFKDLILAYLNSGTRKEELLPSRFSWDNVDLQNRSITVTGKRDKTRIIPMNKTLFGILDRRKNVETHKTPFDFAYHSIYPKLKIYYDRAGIKNADVHTLRRTFGSLMVQSGVPIFTVSKLLGHSSVTITENHYADLLEDNLVKGVQTLEGLTDD